MGFLRGFSVAMGANIIVFVLSFFNNKLIYLFLPETDNGIFFLMLRYSMFMVLLLGEWLRLSDMNVAGKDKNLVPVLSANGLWFSAAIILLAVPAAFVCFHIKGEIFGIPARILPIVFIVAAFLMARNNWQSLLLVRQRMFSYGFSFILWASVFLALDLLFLVVFKYGLYYVILALVVASLASALWSFGAIIAGRDHTFLPSLRVFGMSGRIGVRAWIASLGMFLMTNIHVFTLKPLAGAGAEGLVMVAMFSVGFRIFSLFQRASSIAGTVLYSHVVQQDDKQSSRLTMLVTRNIMLLSVIFGIIAAVTGKIIIIIVASTRYLPAYIPVLLMLPGIVAVNVGSVINSYYWGRTYQTNVIAVPYIATIAGAILNLLLVPRFGISGAALSFSVMSVAWLAYQSIRFSRDTGLSSTDILVPRYADILRLVEKITFRTK